MNERGIVLSDFQVVRPPNEASQSDLNQWTLRRHLATREVFGAEDSLSPEQYEKIFGRYAVRESMIAKRSFECDDIQFADFARARIYPVHDHQKSGSDIGTRTRFFVERASRVFDQIYDQPRADKPSHMVHVTCTGYRSPSAAQLAVAKREWGDEVAVTHAYHMGCYAALPAVRIAEGFIAAKQSFRTSSAGKPKAFNVDIVHTEMCGLHMNPAANTPEQIVVQSLFADGHIKYNARLSETNSPGFRVQAIKEKVVTGSDQDMSWAPEAWGLQMNLSREVPEKIKGAINIFFARLAEEAGTSAERLLSRGIFAIHPGGPKIIQAVQEAMSLSDEQTQYSKRILLERGNMSSATLPHVWNSILEANVPSGTPVVSFAFGPGLTIFGSVFETL